MVIKSVGTVHIGNIRRQIYFLLENMEYENPRLIK
jgi:hypothetical protein